MVVTDIHSHAHALADINKMLAYMDKPIVKISAQQQYWQDQAIKSALNQKASMAVIEVDHDHFQVWPLEKFGTNNVFVAEYVEVEK